MRDDVMVGQGGTGAGIGGWTCGRCGSFVLSGNTHSCRVEAFPNALPMQPIVQPPWNWYADVLQRLDRVIALLEAAGKGEIANP